MIARKTTESTESRCREGDNRERMTHRSDNQGKRWTNEKGVAQAALTSQPESRRRGYRIGNEQRPRGTTVKKGEQRGERKPKTEEGTAGRGEDRGRDVDGPMRIGRVAMKGVIFFNREPVSLF